MQSLPRELSQNGWAGPPLLRAMRFEGQASAGRDTEIMKSRMTSISQMDDISKRRSKRIASLLHPSVSIRAICGFLLHEASGTSGLVL